MSVKHKDMSVFLNESHTNNLTPLLVPISVGNGATGPTGPTGPRGPALNMRGSVATAASLPGGAALGDAYIALNTGDIWTWVGTLWFNSGQFDGPQGAQGITGPTGTTGPIGPAGEQGDVGLYGQVGIAGATGPTGAVGQPGQVGVQGNPGLAGPAGPTGAGDSLSSAAFPIAQNVFIGNLPFPAVWNTYVTQPADPQVVKSGHILVCMWPIYHQGAIDVPTRTMYQNSILYKVVGQNYATAPSPTTKWLSTPGTYGLANVAYQCDFIVLTSGVDYDATTTQFDFMAQIGANSFNNTASLTIAPDYNSGLAPGNFKMTFIGLP